MKKKTMGYEGAIFTVPHQSIAQFLFREGKKGPFVKRNNEIPYYFDEDEVLRIFAVCHNS